MIGIYDVHCHILPGVDDGAKTLEEAVQLLKAEYAAGVRSVILTPHFRRRMFEPPMELVYDAYERLRYAVRRTNLNLYLGCEYHVNMDITADLQNGVRPSMADSEYVLCEFSAGDAPAWMKERCRELVSRGFRPILAHIERYPELTKDFHLIEELTDLGCFMQVNAGSVLGDDGFRAKQFCKKLIREELLHFIGSDAHDLKHRPPRLGACASYLEKRYGEAYVHKIMCEHPARIVERWL